MCLKRLLPSKTSNDEPRLGNGDARERIFRFCEAINGCVFYFHASLIKNLLAKTVFASYYLKHSLPMFLKCFFILPNFSLIFLIDMFLIKNNVYTFFITISKIEVQAGYS